MSKKDKFRSMINKFISMKATPEQANNFAPYRLAADILVDMGFKRVSGQSDVDFVRSKSPSIQAFVAKEEKKFVANSGGAGKRKAKAHVGFKPTSYRGDVNDDAFLKSYQWRSLRMNVLVKFGPRCQCCGATSADGVRIHVDHIKPRRTHPHLALVENNLQILCEECNHGKGSWDRTDWRGMQSDLIDLSHLK